MALDDYVEPEIAAAIAAATALLSPRLRGLVRRGAVVGLAALFAVGDALGAAGRDVARGARPGGTGGPGLQDITSRPPAGQDAAEER